MTTYFDAFLADVPPSPLVVSVPHASVNVVGFESSLAPSLDVRCDADLFVDELYEPIVRGALVVARISRFVCDLNRHPDDVSRRVVPSHPAPQNSDGRGFLWEVTTTGAPAVFRALTYAEWKAREQIHAAYHATITQALERARARFGFAVLLDGHSMPSFGRTGHKDAGKARADFVPGDRDGTSCDPRLTALVSDHLQNAGFTVAANDPYKGGFITRHHGQPAHGIHAIQLEMRRDLYMDEQRFERRPDRMAAIQNVLETLLRKVETLDLRRP